MNDTIDGLVNGMVSLDRELRETQRALEAACKDRDELRVANAALRHRLASMDIQKSTVSDTDSNPH